MTLVNDVIARGIIGNVYLKATEVLMAIELFLTFAGVAVGRWLFYYFSSMDVVV